MAKITGAKAAVEILRQEGIRHVFHLPGSQIIDILDEIYQSPIRAIMARHEQGAAFMAEGYARASRGVGVCMSTVGPGAVNLVSGIAASYKAGTPVIAITGVHDQKMLEKDSFHEIDQVGVFKPITKWSAAVQQSEKIPEMMRKAFRVALTGRKGPVHLAILDNASKGRTDFKKLGPARYRSGILPTCPEETIDQMVDLLKKARFPFILAGVDTLWSKAGQDLTELAEAAGIPVGTLRDSWGAFPGSHPLGVGLVARSRGEVGNRTIQRADLILALGVKFDFQSTRYSHDVIPQKARLIHVANDPEEVGRIYPVDIGAVCDAGPVIKALAAKVKAGNIRFNLMDAVAEIKKIGRKKLDGEVDDKAIPLQPQAIVRTLRRTLPPDTIIVLDGGNFAKHVRRQFDILEIDTYHYPDDFGSVGASFPMALGVKVAFPQRPVACLNGDGAFLLNSQELETAVREKINVLTVVFNDFGFGNVRAYQKTKFDCRFMCDHDNPPFDKMARLFKAEGARAETLEELERAVRKGLKTPKPYVIDVMMTAEALEKPGFVGN